MALRLEDLDLGADSSLVDRARSGDPSAFEDLYHRHHDRLYRFCLYQLGARHDAEDAVQEAFARAWKNLPNLVGDGFYPWLRVIARNLCADVGRRRARVEPMADVDPGQTEDCQDVVAGQSDIEVLRMAMERLPERHRLALEMRERDELSYQEIAERAGITLGTVESLLWRARQGLKRQFQLIAGAEGALAGVPGIGWALVRLRRWSVAVRTRASNWITSVPSGVLVSPMAAVALGSALAVGGSWTSGSVPLRTRPLSAAAQVVTARSAVPTASTVDTGAAPASEPTVVSPTTTSTSTNHRPLVRSSYSEAASGARSDPIHAGALGVSAGVDPGVAQADLTNTASKTVEFLAKGTP